MAIFESSIALTGINLRQDPFEAILVIFGRSPYFFFFKSSWKNGFKTQKTFTNESVSWIVEQQQLTNRKRAPVEIIPSNQTPSFFFPTKIRTDSWIRRACFSSDPAVSSYLCWRRKGRSLIWQQTSSKLNTSLRADIQLGYTNLAPVSSENFKFASLASKNLQRKEVENRYAGHKITHSCFPSKTEGLVRR